MARAQSGKASRRANAGRAKVENSREQATFKTEPNQKQEGVLAAAERLMQRRGWYLILISLHHDANGVLQKKPLIKSLDKTGVRWGATPHFDVLRADYNRLARQHANIGLGVPLGVDNNVFALELDTPLGHADRNDMDYLHALEQQHGKLPTTLTARTPTGSMHFYFKLPYGYGVDFRLKNKLGPIEVKCEGHYLVAPPTLRPSYDIPYHWIDEEAVIAEAPAWVLALITEPITADAGNGGDSGEYEDPYLVAATVACIPNHDGVHYDEWIANGMRIKKCIADDAIAFAIWDTWSKYAKKKYNAEHTAATWPTLKPTRTGYGVLVNRAREANPDWENRTFYLEDELTQHVVRFLWVAFGVVEEDDGQPVKGGRGVGMRGKWRGPEDAQSEPDDGEPDAEDEQPKPEEEQPKSTAEEVTLIDPWDRYLVPPFPIDVFPTLLQDYVAAQAEIIGCDPTCIAMNTLATFSGALDHRFALKMMRNSNWCATPRLWVLIIGDPATRKTPSMDAVLLPLKHQDYRMREDWHRRHKEWEAARRQDRNTELPEPEPPPRYVVNDTTVEKLSEILARSPKGVLVAADEVAGWIGSMERYGNARGMSDRAFWLQAHNGGPYTVDRIKRGEIYVKNLSASILGGIQPERLKEITNLTSDGLLQRFLPVMIREATFAKDRPIKDEAYGNLVHEMMKATPTRLEMAEDALANMDRLRMHLHDLECVANEVSFGFQSFVGKLPVVCGTFALIFYLIEEILDDTMSIGVQWHMVEKARRLIIDFILPHANEFYSIGGGVHERVRKVASWILINGIEAIIPSEITSTFKAFRHLGGPGANQLMQINLLLSPLVTGGWLWPDDTTPVCRHWRVAPAVHAKFAARAATERARRAALQGLLKRP
jgi:hypothetical protein